MNTTIHIIKQLKWSLLTLTITYIGYIKEFNDKDPKFKVGDHVKISKYKKVFAKEYTPNWLEDVFVIKEVRNTVPWTYAINNWNRLLLLLLLVIRKDWNILWKRTTKNKDFGKKKSLKEN